MKNIFFILLFVLSFSMMGQEPTHKIVGNEIVKISSTKVVEKDVETTLTYKIKDKVYKVYKSRRNAYYVIRTSKKTGKEYKQYLKV